MKQPVDPSVTIIPAVSTAPPDASNDSTQGVKAEKEIKAENGSGVENGGGGEVVVLPAAKRETVYVAAYCRVSTDLEDKRGAWKLRLPIGLRLSPRMVEDGRSLASTASRAFQASMQKRGPF